MCIRDSLLPAERDVRGAGARHMVLASLLHAQSGGGGGWWLRPQLPPGAGGPPAPGTAGGAA
eukprot:6315316-Alexandrium_andersonii.AAC.1